MKKQEAQSKDLSMNSQATTLATHKERMLLKEIKKEKPPTFDMFEESAGTKTVKKEESDICGLMAVKKEEGYKGFKTEACEISIIKSEASSPEFCPSVSLVSPLIKPGGLQDPLDQLQPALLASAAQPDAAELTAGMKQEIQQPSDSDDDFSVDVMLDNLQYEKPENTGERVSDQQGSESAVEGGTVSVSKSKNQVKRVTWNIQEPEGPQPEKSPSSKCCQIFISYIKNLVFAFVVLFFFVVFHYHFHNFVSVLKKCSSIFSIFSYSELALYKLKLKQEGVRRPSATGQNSSQVGVSPPVH